MRKIDNLDRRILEILQADATLPIATIAARIGLSQTPCWRRIQRMRSDGIIEATVALIRPEAIGLGLTVFISIQAPAHTTDWLSAFTNAVITLPEILEVYRMAGDVDYLLRVAVADMTAFDLFYRTLIDTIPMKNVSSHFAMEQVKRTTAYPL